MIEPLPLRRCIRCGHVLLLDTIEPPRAAPFLWLHNYRCVDCGPILTVVETLERAA
jgi:DNA-directed RNA polymerase subunit RPC12/RpoP